jgi:hypothetical protein
MRLLKAFPKLTECWKGPTMKLSPVLGMARQFEEKKTKIRRFLVFFENFVDSR